MEEDQLITKMTKIIQRKDGSEVRIVAQALFGRGMQRSVDVQVSWREGEKYGWKVCNKEPHPDWMEMSINDYIDHGRSEMLQTVSPGEILSVTSQLGKPMKPR